MLRSLLILAVRVAALSLIALGGWVAQTNRPLGVLILATAAVAVVGVVRMGNNVPPLYVPPGWEVCYWCDGRWRERVQTGSHMEEFNTPGMFQEVAEYEIQNCSTCGGSKVLCQVCR